MTWRQGALALAVLGGALAGCTPVPSSPARPSAAPQRPPSAPVPPSPAQVVEPPPAPVVPVPAAPIPTRTGQDEQVAVSCAGHPSAERIIALVRSNGMLTGNATVTVQTGPLCAGSWQYTVLTGTGREPLQVVSLGTPEALQLVAAGTDICSVQVRGQAPPGILSVAQCQ